MKKQFRVTFFGMGTMKNNRRLEDELKNEYWIAGKEPENWQYFDGDIVVERQLDRGEDCFLLSMTEGAWFVKYVLTMLKDKKDVRSVEIKHGNEFFKTERDIIENA